MFKSLFTLCLLSASTAWAGGKGYDLKLDFSINGKHIASPKLTVKAGELSTIIQKQNGKKIFMDIVASDNPDDKKAAIRLQFVVGNILSSGQQEAIARSRLIALENQKAEISSSDKSGKNNVHISVVATRLK